jgi:hypothetical protein
VAAIVSLHGWSLMRFRPKRIDESSTTVQSPTECSLLLAPRSLLVFCNRCYQQMLHSIDSSAQVDFSVDSLLNPEELHAFVRRCTPSELDPSGDTVSLSPDGTTASLRRRVDRLSLTVRLVPRVLKLPFKVQL